MDERPGAPERPVGPDAGGRWHWPWLPFTFLMLLVFGLFYGVVLRGETFFDRDLVLFFRPLRVLLAELWSASRGLPLWDPLTNMGREFAANPSAAVFHPLSWLFLFLPWETAWHLQVLVPVLASFAGMLFFLRTVGRSGVSAFFAACAWGFGGVVLSTTNVLSMLLTVAPAPLVAAFAVRTLRSRRGTDIAAAALCFALVCAGGEPVSLLIAVLIVGAAVAAELVDGNSHAGGRAPHTALHGVALVAAGLALGTAAAAATLAPAVRLEASSDRGQGIPLARAEVWSFPPVRFAELALPGVMGHIGTDMTDYWGARAYGARAYPLIYSVYPGLFATVLGLSGLARPRRGRLVWTGVGVIAALLALGRHVPVWSLLYAGIPSWRAIRHPERFTILLAFALAVLAAGELDAVLSGDGAARRRAALWLVGAAGLAALAGVTVLASSHWSGAKAWAAVGIAPAITAYFAHRFPLDCLLVVGLALAYLLALRTVRHAPPVGAALVCAVLVLDLVIAGRPLVPTTSPREVAAMFPPPRGLVGPHPTKLFNLAEWQSEGSARTLAPSMGVPALWGVTTVFEPDPDMSQPTWATRARRLFWRAANAWPDLMPPLLQRRGVGAILLFRDGELYQPGGKAPPELGPMRLVHLDGARADAFCADRVARFQGDEAWLREAHALGRALASSAIVEVGDAPALPPRPSPCRIGAYSGRPGVVQLHVTAEGPAPSLLAINQTWNPRWSATVDGGPGQIIRTDLDLTAIPLQPGDHTVRLVYRDRLLDASLAVSIAALLGIMGLAALGRGGR